MPVVTLPKGTTVDSPGVAGELKAALGKVQAALPDARVASYASTHDRAFVSKDGRTTFALVSIPARGGVDPGQAEARRAQAAARRHRRSADRPSRSPGSMRCAPPLPTATMRGGASLAIEAAVAGAGALLVLAFVFASWMAIVPLLMAIVAIPTTFLLIWPLATVTDVSIIVKFLAALIGLAIAIDYALLVVVRWREERLRPGTTNEAAVVQAMQHAGRAVVFSGSTVAISLLALVVLPVPFLRSLGIAGMLIPLVSVAVAVTLLPVVLATIGPRLDRRAHGRAPIARAVAGRPGRAWSCATAGPRPSRRSSSWARSSSRPPRFSSATRAPTRWPSRARRARDSSSSRPRASAPGRSRRSSRWSAPAIPRPSPAPWPASKVSRARSPPPTGAGTAPPW